jgi:tetratricopeptide (TPR) repeat protein
VFQNLAYALERLGQFADAEAALEQAAARGGADDPRVRTSLGVLALRRGEASDALALLIAARPLWGKRPPPAAWFHFTALAMALTGEVAQGHALLLEALTQHPHAAGLYNNLAAICERQGRYGDAAVAIERGLQEDAGLAQLHKNAGDYAYRGAHYDDALDAYHRATRANPALGPDVFLKIGNILFRRGEPDGAIRSWTRALEIDPGCDIARNNLEMVR